MNIHPFGNPANGPLVMIHGACMRWDMLQESIDILSRDYYVLAIAVDGMDPAMDNEFTSVEALSAELEEKLLDMGIWEIECLYGLSMGGGFVIRMLADNRIPVRFALIDAGITPYELPWLVTRLILVKDFLMTEWGKHSLSALKLAFPPEKYTEEGVRFMYDTMRCMSATTIWRVFDSTDNYRMPKSFPKIDTKIAYWYGEAEKKARKLDIRYVRKHIPNVVFREIPGMDHGQYALMRPEAFCADIKRWIHMDTPEK